MERNIDRKKTSTDASASSSAYVPRIISTSKFSGCSLTDLIKKNLSEQCLKGKEHTIRNNG